MKDEVMGVKKKKEREKGGWKVKVRTMYIFEVQSRCQGVDKA